MVLGVPHLLPFYNWWPFAHNVIIPNGPQTTKLLTFFSIIIKQFWEMSMIKHFVEWRLGGENLLILTLESEKRDMICSKIHHKSSSENMLVWPEVSQRRVWMCLIVMKKSQYKASSWSPESGFMFFVAVLIYCVLDVDQEDCVRKCGFVLWFKLAL